MNKSFSYSLSACALIGALAFSFSAPTAATQENQPVTCVKRTATAKPPPFPAGPRPKPKGGKGYEPPEVVEGRTLLRLSCAEGEVPVVKEFRAKKNGLMKGNPLIAPEQRLERQGEMPQRKIFRKFRDVYKPEGRRNPPPPPPGPPACDGVWQDGACYYYGSAAVTRSADGGGMTTAVERPTYVNTGGSGHSLNEIAIQAGESNGDIVELGWLVSSDQYGDVDPHIFVFHWIGGVPQCYDGCNWHNIAAPISPARI